MIVNIMIATDSSAPPARRAPLALLTVREVAFALGCGRTSVYGLIARGELPTVKVGRLTRIPVSAVAEFVSRGVAGEGLGSPMRQGPATGETRNKAAGAIGGGQALLFDDAHPEGPPGHAPGSRSRR